MEFKRIYDETDLARYQTERAAKMDEWRNNYRQLNVPEKLVEGFAKQTCDEVISPPLIAGLEIVHTGVSLEQNFSTPLITDLIQVDIAEIQGDQLTLHTSSEDLHYTIKRQPGRYCLHCGEKLQDDINGELARLHVAMKHKSVPSPSENDPAGYVWLTYFECVLDEQQHARYKKGA